MSFSPRYTSLDSVKAWGHVNGLNTTGDDPAILLAIARAEEAIDCACGTSFDARTVTLRRPEIAFVDAYGWLHAQMYYPIETVSAVQVMDMIGGDTTYTSITLTTVELQHSTLDYPNEAPVFDSYWLQVYSSSPLLPSRAVGQMRAQVTYTGGFSTIPSVIESVTDRLAWWFYKIREAPMGRIATLTMPVMEVPLDFPPDVAATLKSWARLNA